MRMRFLTVSVWISAITMAAAAAGPGSAQVRPPDFVATGVAKAASENKAQTGVAQNAAGELTDQDIADVARVNAYLNDLGALQGRFQQISETGGYAEGKFYLKMPGRIRFDYDPPHELGFVSDGRWVAVDDRALDVVNRYPLDSTPLKFLVKDNVDLLNEAKITAVERVPGQLRITAEEDEGPAQGKLTMIFTEPVLELRQWVVEDVQGGRTTVLLNEVEPAPDLSNRLFLIADDTDDFQ